MVDREELEERVLLRVQSLVKAAEYFGEYFNECFGFLGALKSGTTCGAVALMV